jgi:hypothetical protein
LENRRRVQAAADAAALAAADDLYINTPRNTGMDLPKTADQVARNIATANGYTNDPSGPATVVVNIPPLSGKFTGQAGYAEVIITYQQPRYFSGVIGTGTVAVKARAVARGQWVPFNNGIIILDPTSSGSLSANGNGNLKVLGSSIIVNSNNSTAATTVGNAIITDPDKPVYITGSNPGYSGTITGGTIYTGVPPTPDPLAYLPAPDTSTLTVQRAGTGTTISLQPGIYNGGLSFSGQQTINMAPGIYYMQGGGFTVSGSANISGTGVMIYSQLGMSITGNGTVTLSPPATGIYKGISYFQSRTDTSTALVAGDGKFNVTGTVYVPAGLFNAQGNGDVSIAGQVVAWQMKEGGNGAVNINFPAGPSAPKRVIQLVE